MRSPSPPQPLCRLLGCKDIITTTVAWGCASAVFTNVLELRILPVLANQNNATTMRIYIYNNVNDRNI